jgi:hypothetical protein
MSNPKEVSEPSCINCDYFYSRSPDISQPYPEFACIKGHWDGIASSEEYDELFEEIDCKDFTVCKH